MRKCNPKYRYFGDGHVMCEADCPKAIHFVTVNERSKEQLDFKGCPELLNAFYLREIWLRGMGMQKVAEETRNLTEKSLKKADGVNDALKTIGNVFSRLGRIASDNQNRLVNQKATSGRDFIKDS